MTLPQTLSFCQLGPLENVSRIVFGGAGMGEVWGATNHEEALAALDAAIASGINLIDGAPRYRTCEAIIGEVLGGKCPAGLRITTKCQLGQVESGKAADVLEASLDTSLKTMRIDSVDVFLLHNYVADDDAQFRFF
jgi:aryl-alcohol dehydrogenase-like predicted oxidoreductase